MLVRVRPGAPPFNVNQPWGRGRDAESLFLRSFRNDALLRRLACRAYAIRAHGRTRRTPSPDGRHAGELCAPLRSRRTPTRPQLARAFAAIFSIFILLIESNILATHKTAEIFRSNVSLLEMEEVLFKIYWIGFALLTITLISGIFFSEEVMGVALTITHKIIFSILQGGRGFWAVYYTSPQTSMITLSYSLAQQLWGLLLNFDWSS